MVSERRLGAIIKGIWSVFLCLLLSLQGGAASPHVLVVVTDKLPADMGAWEKEAVTLNEFFLRPTGVATRAALWTGREEFRCGVVARGGGRNWLRGDVQTIADVFATAGYSTGMFGTWGLGENVPSRPQDHGFQKVEVHGGEFPGAWCDVWGAQGKDPSLAALQWMTNEAKAGKRVLLGLVLPVGVNSWNEISAQLEKSGLTQETLVVVLEDQRSSVAEISSQTLQSRCLLRWPGVLPAGKKLTGPSVPMDLVPSICTLAGVPKPETADDGADIASALLGTGTMPAERILCLHQGNWRGDESPASQRSHGFAAWDKNWWLQGASLFDWKKAPTQDCFEEQTKEATRLLADYGRWWQRSQPFLLEPVSALVGSDRQPVVRLAADSWWPSLEATDAIGVEGALTQAQVQERLEQMRIIGTRQVLPAMCGRWRIQVAKTGNYRIRAWLVPPEAPPEAKERWGALRVGEVHLRAGKHEAVGKVRDGATEIVLTSDWNEGPAEIEVWFTNQLTGKKIQGALGIEIERMGERRTPDLRLDLDLKDKTQK